MSAITWREPAQEQQAKVSSRAQMEILRGFELLDKAILNLESRCNKSLFF